MKKVLILEDNRAMLEYLCGLVGEVGTKTMVFPFDRSEERRVGKECAA